MKFLDGIIGRKYTYHISVTAKEVGHTALLSHDLWLLINEETE